MRMTTTSWLLAVVLLANLYTGWNHGFSTLSLVAIGVLSVAIAIEAFKGGRR